MIKSRFFNIEIYYKIRCILVSGVPKAFEEKVMVSGMLGRLSIK